MVRSTFAGFVALSLVSGLAVAVEFRAQPANATLKDNERTYPRLSVETDWFPTHLVGERRYRVAANTVNELAGPDKSQHRQACVTADCELRWIGSAQDIAFLVAERDPAKLDDDPESHMTLHRLDLGSMKWLDPFKLPKPSIEPSTKHVVHFGGGESQQSRRHVLPNHLLVTPTGIAVLYEETLEQQDAFAPKMMRYDSVGYHVSWYAAKETEAKWSRTIRPVHHAGNNIGVSMKTHEHSIERLTYVAGSADDDLILVCIGERDVLTCLKAADGKVCWRVPALWEYERGFIGPSVFEHYIERFGQDCWTVQAAKSPMLTADDEQIDRKMLHEKIQLKMGVTRVPLLRS